MTHTNRGRLTVDIDGKWRLYTNTIPGGSEALGTVTQGEGDTGALVKLQSGLYAQVNAGAIRNLDGRKVAAALGTAGRPAEMDSGKRRNPYLSDADWDLAKRIGEGNASEGIRKALAAAQQKI
jgi:hypothetical protein